MQRSSLALALAAALGTGAVLTAAPALAQQASPFAAAPIRTGSSSIDGAFGVRLSVYDARSFELFWDRVPGAATYRVRVGSRTVQENTATSRYVANVDPSGGFDYALSALDRSGNVLASRAFRVQPAADPQLVGRGETGGSGGSAVPAPANLRSAVYSGTAAEVFWDRASRRGLSYEVRRGGSVVTTTDGTSAFLSGLPGTTGQRIEVVAIAPDGTRSAAASVTLGGDSGGGGGGNAPAAPTGLRAEVYSSSAGEVFWDRPIGKDLSRTYEVSLDGEVVATTRGTSYFASGREGIRGTRVEVVAIGPDGARSAASSVTFGEGGTTGPDPDPGADAPPAPANARLEVYSGTAAELFFDRAPASANVIRTEISRDGEIIGGTNGTSFFDDSRRPDMAHVYELVAIDAAGNRSAVTTVGGESPPAPGTPADSATFLDRPWSEVARLAARVLEGSSLDVVDREVSAAVETLGPFPEPDFSSDNPFEDVETSGAVACTDGGTLSWRRTRGASGIGGRGFAFGAEFDFDDCAVGGTTFAGSYRSLDSNGSLQATLGSLDTRDYDLVVRSRGAAPLVARGETSDRFYRDGTAPCDSGVDIDRSQDFGSTISIVDDALGVTVETLSSSVDSDVNLLRFGQLPPDCLPEEAVVFDGRATFTEARSGVTFEVERRGTARFRSAEAAAFGEAADASLEIRVAGEPGTRIRLESDPTDSESARVLVEERGTSIAFEAPWAFGREGARE